MGQLLVFALPLFGVPSVGVIAVGALYILLAGALIIGLGCAPGEAGANRFGPAPEPGLGRFAVKRKQTAGL